jgi:tRNA (guanine-N7-)-methyltransferase
MTPSQAEAHDELRADLRAHGPAGVMRRGIRTYKPRRTRITQRAERALAEQRHLVIPVSDGSIDIERVWGSGVPVVLEIGFGDGLATAAMAAEDPATGVLAVDVHTPGVGELLWRIDDQGLGNVRVMEADALGVLARMIPPAALAGVRSYFPDPWPKARHHKRRLVQQEVLDLVRSRLVPGGYWHLATDWAEYGAAMSAAFDADPHWSGGAIERPAWRPVTRYERRALRDGRAIVDLVYRSGRIPQ